MGLLRGGDHLNAAMQCPTVKVARECPSTITTTKKKTWLCLKRMIIVFCQGAAGLQVKRCLESCRGKYYNKKG